MKNTVVIKGNKSGMTVILDPEAAYETLLLDIAAKFEESARFWGSVQMTLTLAGRPLTPEQEFEIVNVITEHSQIEILCLVDQDINRIRRCERALKNRLMELSSNTGQFFRGNLKAGELLETETSLVVIGDVEKGAKVSAKGNIIILGALRGAAHAGICGNEDAVIVAFEMAPISVRIAGLSLKKAEKGRHLGRGPMMILSENGKVVEEPIKKSFLSALNFI